MSTTRRLNISGADTSTGCCGTASPTPLTAAVPASACCGDPTPDAATGACCSEPADSCSCQTTTPKRVAGRSGSDEIVATASTRPPVAIIGAGPIGLAAAAHL